MKNSSSIQKNNKSESPKTPGGISKSLLTPCRRVGLSRKWRKSGPSPFISPLSGTERSVEPKQEQKSKKRKCPTEDDSSQEISQNSNEREECNENTSSIIVDTNLTPTRNHLPRKKSKTFLLTKECEEENENIHSTLEIDIKVKNNSTKLETTKDSPENVSKLSRKNSKNKSRIQKPPLKDVTDVELSNREDNKVVKNNVEKKNNNISQIDSKKSPENLTKECMIVIQKKILKCKDNNTDNCNKLKSNNPTSQELFDSDSDNTPLSNLNKKENPKTLINEDDEFQDKKKIVKKLQHKTTSTSELKPNSKVKEKIRPSANKTLTKLKVETNIHSSQESSDNDDDDFAPDKRTILIKKTYDKVTKPSKAKSTGSITQKDIDELKKRIEAKKNLLLAKAMTNETEELRTLIKKWQKGCQNALAELLELMKTKMSDKQNMDYAEILKLLKIPKDLVGYDSENDCFNTPDDSNIILSGFNFE